MSARRGFCGSTGLYRTRRRYEREGSTRPKWFCRGLLAAWIRCSARVVIAVGVRHQILYTLRMPAKVLVVEDSRAMREYVTSVLEGTGGMEFDYAESGFHALQMLSHVSPDLIITDINMPEVSGLELLRYVRKSERLKDVPVVVISTEGHPVDRERAKAAGAAIMLQTPVDPEVLERAEVGWLEGPPG